MIFFVGGTLGGTENWGGGARAPLVPPVATPLQWGQKAYTEFLDLYTHKKIVR